MAAKRPVHPDTPIITSWLKRIFSWKIITGFITIVCFFFAISQFLRDKGGDISMSLNGREVINNEKINNIVFVDSRTTHIGDFFVPLIVNNKEYSVRDFFLQYDLETRNIDIMPYDFYNSYHSGGGMALRYKDNVLYSFTDAESPLSSLALKSDDAWLNVKMKATYDGVSHPYGHEINTHFYVEPMGDGVQFDQWKNRCKQKVMKRTDALRFNAYFVAQNNTDFETIVTIQAMEEYDTKEALTQTKNPDSNQIEKTENKTDGNQYITLSSPSESKLDSTHAKSVSPATTLIEDAKLVRPVNSLEITSLTTAPLNITSIDTLTLSDGSLMATINFEKLKESTTVYFVFDYTCKDSKPSKRKERHYHVRKNNLQVGCEYYELTYFGYNNNEDNLRFIGFATEDESLAQNVEIKKENELTKLQNDNDDPICVEYTTQGGGTTTIAIVGNSSLFIRDEVVSVKYLRIPAIDWRESTWDKVFYGFDGSLSLWVIILFFVISMLVLCALGFFLEELTERNKFWGKHEKCLVIPYVVIVTLYVCFVFFLMFYDDFYVIFKF